MKILLVRLRLIGDVVFTTPLVRALRRHHADATLTYVVEPGAAPVVRHNPHIDDVIELPRRAGLARLGDDLRAGRRLRAGRYDVAIDLHGGPRSAWLTWQSRAPMRIGYQTRGRSWMYTHAVPRPADLGPVHSVVKQWALLAPLGIGPCDRSRDPVEMPADPAAAARVDSWLAEAGLADRTLVVVHVSAGNPFRRWPAAHFAALVTEMAHRHPDRRVILTSGPSEADAARAIVDAARAASPEVGAAVRHVDFDLAELQALTARAAVYIGGDSGPLHIAATTRTPVVGLFGPTLAERSMPWRDPQWWAEGVDAGPLPCRPCTQRRCVPGDFRCLSQIDPGRVAAAAERAIAKGHDDVRVLRA